MKTRPVRWVVALAAVLILGFDHPAPGQTSFPAPPAPADLQALAQRLDAQLQQLAQTVANEVGPDTQLGGPIDHARSLERVVATLVQTVSAPRPNPVLLRGEFQNIDQSWTSYHEIRLGPPPLISTPQALQVVQAIDQTMGQLGAQVNATLGGGSVPTSYAPSGSAAPGGVDPLAFTRSLFPQGQYGAGVPPPPAPASTDLKTLAARLDQQLRQLGQAVAAEVGTESLEGFGAFDHARSLDKVVTQFLQTLNSPQPDAGLLRSRYQNINQSWVQYHTRLGTPPLISTPGVIAASQAVDQTVGMIGDLLGYQGGPGPVSDPNQAAGFSFP